MSERNEQGTGKHPHKSTEEPYPHHEGQSEHKEARGESQRSTRAAAAGAQSGGKHDTSESSDLKEREYRDPQGEVHHHTNTYMDQHEGEK